MKFSFILATCGRTREIGEFISSLSVSIKAVENLAIELIVADQNDDGRLDAVLVNCPSEWRVIHKRIPQKGCCLSRNAVLSMATGDIVAFPDDDCLYAPDTVARVIGFFGRNQDADVVVGLTAKNPGARCGDGAKSFALNRFSVFRHGEMYLQFYRADAIRCIGSFDESFGPGPNAKFPYGGDDSDYLARASLAGLSVWRDESILVWHPPQDCASFSPEKITGYGKTRMALLRKLKYPLWFRLANLCYPLARLVVDPSRCRYWLAMFSGRFKGLWCGSRRRK